MELLKLYWPLTTQSETLSVYIDDEQAMFSDGEQMYCHSLAPLRAYREKQQQHIELEAKAVIDILEFKAERDNYELLAAKATEFPN